MSFKFTEEQIMIRDMVREFTKNEVEPRDKWMDENGFDHDLHKKLAESGLMGIHIPEQYGGGGSDAAAIKSICIQQEDGTWLLNGGKAWITNSGVADYYIMLAKTDPEAGAKGISAFIVPKDAEGLIVGKFEDKMGMRGTSTCELSFDNIVLPADALIGKTGQGFKFAMMALDGARISIGAIAAGLSHHAMSIAKKYANERVAFGKPIGKHQGIQFKFADMSTEIRIMELLTYDTAQMKAEGKRHTLEAAQLKLFCATRCTQLCLECQQILGGNGYSKEYHVERFVRDAKLLEIGEGTNEILRMLIGGTVLSEK